MSATATVPLLTPSTAPRGAERTGSPWNVAPTHTPCAFHTCGQVRPSTAAAPRVPVLWCIDAALRTAGQYVVGFCGQLAGMI